MALISLDNEEVLLERLKRDDEVSFAHIYQHYWKSMLLVAWNHTKDKGLAEDIVHEVFMQLWEKRKDQDIGSIAGYLTTAVKFSVFKYYRKEQRRKELAQENNLFAITSIDDEAKIQHLFLEEYVKGIVEQMPEKCRLVFTLSRFEGMKNPEIAAILQISEKGVEANLTRALKTLKKHMKRDGILLLCLAQVVQKYVQ